MNTQLSRRHFPALVVFAGAVIYRFGAALVADSHPGWLHNFAPVTAIALCGALLFPRRLALWLPLAILLASDLVLNAHYGASMLSAGLLLRYGALVLVALLGMALQGRPRFFPVIAAAAGSSLLFYVVSNTGAWLAAPEYARTLAGWIQAQTVGQPGYPPSWLFLRNAFLADVGFTAVFMVAYSARAVALFGRRSPLLSLFRPATQ